MEENTELYRHFDHEGKLLYVGISLSSVARLAQHRDQSKWFDQIKRVEIEVFPTREEACAAEKLAISKESPKFNVMHGAYRPPKFRRIKDESIREMVDPNRVYSHAECSRILGIKADRLSKLVRYGGIGCIFVTYSTQINMRVVEFKGQNIIDYVEVRKNRGPK